MSVLIKGIEMPKTGVYILSVDNSDKDKTIFTIAEHTHSGKIIPRHVGEAISEQPERKHGEWKEVTDRTMDCCYHCSECGFLRDAYFLEVANFCPNCGADMRKGKANENRS